tara:strand:+ start:1562 stop:2053 length:492 start_codon:yes stop_codon:yes gene_type:complete
MMNIDIEGIVREEIRNLIREQLNITTDSVRVTVKPKRTISKRNEPDNGWEFIGIKGKRRTTTEMALHKLEKEKGRRLTPEEKGQAKALVEMDETTENEVKEATIKKARINEIAAEGMAAASKELAEEKKVEPVKPESDNGKEPEATIPKVEDLPNLNSLFGND